MDVSEASREIEIVVGYRYPQGIAYVLCVRTLRNAVQLLLEATEFGVGESVMAAF
jgi:hypothetical protein